MGNIPQVKQPDRKDVSLTLHDHLADHHFMGTPVLPAVEAMEVLAAEALAAGVIQSSDRINAAEFKKFLPLTLDQKTLAA